MVCVKTNGFRFSEASPTSIASTPLSLALSVSLSVLFSFLAPVLRPSSARSGQLASSPVASKAYNYDRDQVSATANAIYFLNNAY